jgi:hypothetical protein
VLAIQNALDGHGRHGGPHRASPGRSTPTYHALGSRLPHATCRR